MKRIVAHYRALCSADQAAALARAIAWEQTVEVVEAAVPPDLRERMVGRVEHWHHDGRAAHFTLSYNPELAVGQITPLFNLIYGNVSLYPNVRLVDLEIPAALATALGGPQFGVAGLRQACGVYERPLLCTALKPRGAEVAYMADAAYRYALGGGDVLKDDQNLAEITLHDFQTRVLAVYQALDSAAQQTGRRCLYFPHVTGSGASLRAQLDFVAGLNLPGVLFCPLALGLELCQQAARDYNLMTLYHPSLGGAFTSPRDHGIAPAVLYGTLYRLAGADVSIFLGPGGRISLSADDNRAISHALSQPLGQIKPTLPCPAGGKTLDLLPELMDLHGPDSVLLVGGALLTHDADLSVGTRRYLDAIRARYPGREQAQQASARRDDSYVLRYQGDGQWSQRQRVAYKAELTTEQPDHTADFRGVARLPLVGTGNEHTSYELRYFELEPGGRSSLECHVHSHTVMVVRGRCVLQRGGADGQNATEEILNPNDIVYIDTLVPHQLRNPDSEPCGFLCLVDRLRDRPQVLASEGRSCE